MYEKKSDKLYDQKTLNQLFETDEFKELLKQVYGTLERVCIWLHFERGYLGYSGEALMSDDAPQFDYVFIIHALRWIHEMRHDKLIQAKYDENQVMIEDCLTALEIKFSHQDFLVDELNKMVSDQQQLIDKLIKEIQNLKISIDGNAQSTRTLEEDVPPHY